LVYVSLKQASSEVVTKLCGPAAGVVAAESLDTLSAARSTLASLPYNPVGWLLAAVGGQEQPRLLSTAVGAPAQGGEASSRADAEAGEAGGAGEAGQAGQAAEAGEAEEPWVLLGRPCKEDYLALWLPGRTTLRPPHAPVADLPPTAAPPHRPAAPYATRPAAASPSPSTPVAPLCVARPSALLPGTLSSSGVAAATAAAAVAPLSTAATSSIAPATIPTAHPRLASPATASIAPVPPSSTAAAATAAATSIAAGCIAATAADEPDDEDEDADADAWHDAWAGAQGRRGGEAATAGGWQRMWCVLHDGVMALFEHRRALDEACGSSGPQAHEFEGLEWSQVSGVLLWPPCAFELQLRDGRTLALAADTQGAAAEWVCSILRLVSRRAVLTLQQEQRGEWETVVTEAPAG